MKKELVDKIMEMQAALPKVPELKKPYSHLYPADAMDAYTKDKEEYDKALPAFREAVEKRLKEAQRMERAILDLFLEEVGLSNAPQWQKDRVITFAYSQGHNGGWDDIYQVMERLATIITE